MLATVPKNIITTANSLANLNYNLIGYLPAPLIYGLIKDSGKGNNARLAMGALMFSVAIPVLTQLFSACSLLNSESFKFIEDEEGFGEEEEEGEEGEEFKE